MPETVGQFLECAPDRVRQAVCTAIDCLHGQHRQLQTIKRTMLGASEVFADHHRPCTLAAIGRRPAQVVRQTMALAATALLSGCAVFIALWGGYRCLTKSECDEARRIFGHSIDLRRVRIAHGALPAQLACRVNGNRLFTTMYVISIAGNQELPTATLIHELVHVWQGATDGPVYMLQALRSQHFGKAYQVSDQDLCEANGDLGRLEREQQAVVVERYWLERYGRQNGKQSGDWHKYQTLARQVYRG